MFEEILELRRPKALCQDAIDLVNETVIIALGNSGTKEVGLRLAAIFDLLASTEYYNSVANRGWTYCPEKPTMLLYPYTNTCPRCIGNLEFKYTKANKPESGQIGMVTTELLCQMLESIFAQKGKNIEVSKASEPIDAIIYDKDRERVLIAEVKSAPMMTLPLAMYCDQMTETVDGQRMILDKHEVVDNPNLHNSRLGIFFPRTANGTDKDFYELNIDWSIDKPFYKAMLRLVSSEGFFDRYYSYWKKAYNAYSDKDRDCSLFWLTNGCGQPTPRPVDWPARRGTGYESVSDGKTSVGMDRTDDIKKAIYQVLKLGSEYKPNDDRVKTGIISNIHAVRHYDEYLESVRDIIWAIDHTRKIERADQISADMPIYNLFDGIIAFTRSDVRDEWIKEVFNFG